MTSFPPSPIRHPSEDQFVELQAFPSKNNNDKSEHIELQADPRANKFHLFLFISKFREGAIPDSQNQKHVVPAKMPPTIAKNCDNLQLFEYQRN